MEADLPPVPIGRTARETAERLLDAGLWPIPLYRANYKGGKVPIGQAWGAERNTHDTLFDAFEKERSAGIGVGLGPGRGPGGSWLIDIEGDGPESEESRLKLFGGEVLPSLGWSSARGAHQLLTADPARMGELFAALAGRKDLVVEGVGKGVGVFHLPSFPALELRLGGYHPDGSVKQFQSVAPPTKGTDGLPRQWNGVGTIAAAPPSFYEALRAAIALAPEPALAPAAAPPAIAPGAVIGDVERRVIAYLATIPGGVSGQGGSNPTFKAACKAGPGFDLDPDTAFRILLDHYNPRCEPPWSEKDLRHKVDDAYKDPKNLPRGWLLNAQRDRAPRGRNGVNGKPPKGIAAVVAPGPARPAIEVNHELHRVLAETLEALPLDPDLFCRGDVLVRVTHEEEEEVRLPGGALIRQSEGMARVVPIEEATLRCRLTAIADYVTWHKDKKGEDYSVPVLPPQVVVRATLAHAHYRGVRPLRAIASAPFPRPDGSLVTEPGYDAATGVYLACRLNLDPIPDEVTREDARYAAEALLEPFQQFPFVSDEDRGVFLAGLLGAIARPGIEGATPGVAVVANNRGVGKGKLIDSIGVIATGHPIPTTSYPYDNTEAVKVKASLALACTELVHLDNIDSGTQYGNGALDSALTSLTVNERILGQSKQTGAIELRPSWFLCGNNITPGKDADRRWLVCNLETDLEHPEERSDLEIADLLGYVAEHRARMVRDALVVLKAHALSGRPTNGWAPLGSFELWDRVVRGAVWYATDWDCNATRKRAALDSPDQQARIVLMNAWMKSPNGGPDGKGITCPEAIRIASGHKENGSFLEANGDESTQLAEALTLFSKDGKIPSARSLGNSISRIKGRNIGGKMFRNASLDHSYVRWRVEPITPQSL